MHPPFFFSHAYDIPELFIHCWPAPENARADIEAIIPTHDPIALPLMTMDGLTHVHPSMYQLVLDNALVTVCSPPEHLPHFDFHPQIVYQHEVKLVNTKLFFNLDIIELRIHTAKNPVPPKDDLRTGDFQVQSPKKRRLF